MLSLFKLILFKLFYFRTFLIFSYCLSSALLKVWLIKVIYNLNHGAICSYAALRSRTWSAVPFPRPSHISINVAPFSLQVKLGSSRIPSRWKQLSSVPSNLSFFSSHQCPDLLLKSSPCRPCLTIVRINIWLLCVCINLGSQLGFLVCSPTCLCMKRMGALPPGPTSKRPERNIFTVDYLHISSKHMRRGRRMYMGLPSRLYLLEDKLLSVLQCALLPNQLPANASRKAADESTGLGSLVPNGKLLAPGSAAIWGVKTAHSRSLWHSAFQVNQFLKRFY